MYVFGVGSLAALAIVIVSGFALALGGPDWWHTNPVGHYFNSLHLWSVELFMALLVIHLWGKFWMAAWRGRRALTWVTGVVAFLASVVECFTGYLSQQNFDSQWIATNGKDAFNAVGWGVLQPDELRPDADVAHRASPDHPDRADRRARAARPHPRRQPPAARQKAPRAGRQEGRLGRRPSGVARPDQALRHPEGRHHRDRGDPGAHRRSGRLLSSPDVPPVTVRSWTQVAPADFLATSASELNGTSLTATYGPPYNTNGTPQSEWFAPADIAGVRQPIDPAQTFVLEPLAKSAPTDPQLAAALAIYNAASPAQQNKWATNYLNAMTKVKFVNGTPVLPAGNYGPVPAMLATELTLARSGAIDADLSGAQPFYGTDFTKPLLLFLEDGAYYANVATADHLTGDQWGVMNETGSYPGQPWLWLFQMWYHVRGWSNSANVDLIAIYMTGVATLLLLFIPFIPGLRDIPRWIPLHRLVWRNWNQQAAAGPTAQSEPGPKPEPAGQK